MVSDQRGQGCPVFRNVRPDEGPPPGRTSPVELCETGKGLHRGNGVQAPGLRRTQHREVVGTAAQRQGHLSRKGSPLGRKGTGGRLGAGGGQRSRSWVRKPQRSVSTGPGCVSGVGETRPVNFRRPWGPTPRETGVYSRSHYDATTWTGWGRGLGPGEEVGSRCRVLQTCDPGRSSLV